MEDQPGITTSEFIYDANGKRLVKLVRTFTGPQSTTTRTTYIGNLYEEEVTTSDAGAAGDKDNPTSTSTPAYTVYYYLGGKMVAMRKEGYPSNNGQYRMVGDHLGSTTLLVDTQTNPGPQVIHRQYYKPYGEVARSYGTQQTTYGYTGQRLDGESGLMYYGARYYDPVLSYFVSADTKVLGSDALTVDVQKAQMSPKVGSEGGTPDLEALNRYSYVLNNPLKYSDPTGHLPATFQVMLTYTYTHMMRTIGVRGSPDPDFVRIKRMAMGLPPTKLYIGPPVDPMSWVVVAHSEWRGMVCENCAWDMKSHLSLLINKRDHMSPGDDIYFTIPGSPENIDFNFNVFGNMWFGFVGAAAGISLPALEAGLMAQDYGYYGEVNQPDLEAARFGYNLYEKYKNRMGDLTYEVMVKEFLANVNRITHQRVHCVPGKPC